MAKRKQIYDKALSVYGEQAQVRMLLEEMSELQLAILKFQRDSENETEKKISNVIDEIADVEIMIEQLKQILNCNAEVTKRKRHKKRRLQRNLRKAGEIAFVGEGVMQEIKTRLDTQPPFMGLETSCTDK